MAENVLQNAYGLMYCYNSSLMYSLSPDSPISENYILGIQMMFFPVKSHNISMGLYPVDAVRVRENLELVA